MKTFLLAVCLALGGCVNMVTTIEVEHDAHGYTWRKTGVVVDEDLRRYWLVTPDRFALRCGVPITTGECAIVRLEADGRYHGYAYRTFGSPVYWRDHADKHFDGFVHPGKLKW